MTLEMRGRRVLVTGSGSGIGLETVRHLVRQDAQVSAVVQTVEQAETLRRELPGVTVFVRDLLDASTCEALPVQAADAMGGLDGLVCCAGLLYRGNAAQTTVEQWDRTFDLNLRSTFFLVRSAIAHMRSIQAKDASVVAVSSQLGQVGYPSAIAYASSKAALNSVVRSLALEFATQGVRVNAVAPGPVRTPMTQAALLDAEANARLVSGIPMGRVGEPAEISEAISFLLSSRASFITGQILCVDGGYTVR